MAQPAQTDPQFKLRLPAALKDRIENAAAENNRSMNAELVARLEESFEHQEALLKIRLERDHYRAREIDLLSRVKRLEDENSSVKKDLHDHQVTMTKQHQMIVKQGEVVDSFNKILQQRDSYINSIQELSDAYKLIISLTDANIKMVIEKLKNGDLRVEEAVAHFNRITDRTKGTHLEGVVVDEATKGGGKQGDG
jgi:hypothetical protein